MHVLNILGKRFDFSKLGMEIESIWPDFKIRTDGSSSSDFDSNYYYFIFLIKILKKI